METTLQESRIIEKTRELCQAILEEPGYKKLRQQIETFIANPEAQNQYQVLSEKSEYLNHKQHQGLPLTGEEITEFESLRDRFMQNPVAQGFMQAQEELQRVHQSVSQYVSKTFELGRVPEESDFQGGSCGTGCGCH
jgi:cell fate (sporulation/competence/biofilm development) regulator YlbF (YheA/YmcA/DUF963 family)